MVSEGEGEGKLFTWEVTQGIYIDQAAPPVPAEGPKPGLAIGSLGRKRGWVTPLVHTN